jgi:transcriptional regulator with XRE-family HTH domain
MISDMVSRVPIIIRDARVRAGLTQSELASRMGTTQSAVARLEKAGANPTIDVLERALIAAGHRLEIDAAHALPPVDDTLIAERIRMTPAERLASFASAYRELSKVVGKARPAG